MAQTRERNNMYPVRSVRLPLDVTLDLYEGPYRRAYRFLHKTGEYMREGTSEKDAVPMTVSTWPDALMYAVRNDASYIVNFWEKRVHFRVNRYADGSAPAWFLCAPILHPRIEDYNNAEAAPYEPLPDGSQPKRKHPSGAQKRKLYGTPPSRKR